MVNVVFYEGGIKVSLFGIQETPEWTMCIYCCTFCQWDYLNDKLKENELEMTAMKGGV